MRTAQPDGSVIELADGMWRRWRRGLVVVERPLTEEETVALAAAEAAAGNAATVRDRLTAALESNAAFLALQTPTQSEVLVQIRRLTRQANGLIHHVFAQLDDIADTE